MRRIRLRFVLWVIGLVALYLLANLRLRVFPHILLIFWILLPILSLLFSFLSRKHLSFNVDVKPGTVQQFEDAYWFCTIKNKSKFMSFLLTFPDLKYHDGKNLETLELMLLPGEEQVIELPFQAHYTGPYVLNKHEPVFEDLLGFFWLSLSKDQFAQSQKSLLCLPSLSEDIFTDQQDSRLAEYRSPIEKKSLNEVTDEVYSIEPKRQGQSLSQAHWKLSARMQQWMIKHYSEKDIHPLRLVVDLDHVEKEPELYFENMENKILDNTSIHLLQERNRLLDSCYSFAKSVLDSGGPIEITERTGEDIFKVKGQQNDHAVQVRLAAIPFEQNELTWHLDTSKDRRQVLFLQTIDEKTLGSLLRFKEQKLDFLVLSYHNKLSQGMEKTLEDHSISCLWIDKE